MDKFNCNSDLNIYDKLFKNEKKNHSVKINKHNDFLPDPKISNASTIKWLRSKLNNKIIEKSTLTIMPKERTKLNFDTIITNDDIGDKKRKIQKWLDEIYPKKQIQREKIVNPKYLYTTEIQKKIYKIRDLFLEFDQDHHKLSLHDLHEMFKRNNINVTLEELKDLFFKGKRFKKNEEPSMNFYEFMKFALCKDSDQNFRNFIRKVKKRINETKQSNFNTLTISKHTSNSSGLFSTIKYNVI
jgi:hypothetical protein